MSILNTKTAIITGASSGIGRATALLFAAQGANLVVSARRQDKLESLVEEITQSGGKAVAVAGDIADEETSEKLVETALAEFGGLDIAFNNAGTLGEMGAPTDVSNTGWDETMRINLTSAFYGAKYQLAAMQKRGSGSIIFTSTFLGYTAGMPGTIAYSTAKAGLVGLTQSIAVEYGAQNIRANTLILGGVDTDMAKPFTSTPEALDFVKGLHAIKRVAQPDEIAQSVLYLASDASSFTTGTAMRVDGGVSINRT